MKLHKFFILLAVSICLFSVAVYASASLEEPTPVNQIHGNMFPVGSQQQVAYTSALNVRTGPGPEYSRITYVSGGTVITVLEYKLKWVKIDTANGQGWIYAGYLSRNMTAAPILPETHSKGNATITVGGRTPQSLLRADIFPVGSQAIVDFASHVNIRKGAGNEYSAFTHLTKGTQITILEYDKLWVRVDTPNGQGWIYSGFLSNEAVMAARDFGASSVNHSSNANNVNIGTPSSYSQLSADMFPIGSQQTVEYCYFLNVRNGAGINYGVFTSLSRGTVIIVREYKDGWIKIDTNGNYGWIYAGYLKRL